MRKTIKSPTVVKSNSFPTTTRVSITSTSTPFLKRNLKKMMMMILSSRISKLNSRSYRNRKRSIEKT